jgi:hypothetical protein
MLCRHTVTLAVLSLPLDRSPIQVLPGLQQSDALPAHCSTGDIELTAGQVPYTVHCYLGSNSWMLCRRIVPLAVLSLPLDRGPIQYYLGSNSWMLCRHTVSLAVLSLPLDRSPRQVLPGLQQFDALPAHCSTGGIELTAGQVP